MAVRRAAARRIVQVVDVEVDDVELVRAIGDPFDQQQVRRDLDD
jgi:hypothetical protein